MIRSLTDRTDLRKEIPLEKPLVLIVEPTNICNYRCRFCPITIPEHGRYKHAPPHNMTFDEFKHVIDSAKDGFGHIKTLQLYNLGEPLINKNIVRMINYVKDVDLADSLRIFSNGALLNPTLSIELAEALGKGGKSIVQFSIEHVNDEGYKEVTGVKQSYDSLLTNIAYFYVNANHENTFVICKLIRDCTTPEDERKFKKDFSRIGDSVHVESVTETIEKEDFTHKQEFVTYDGKKVTTKMICTNPFYILCVNSNLTINACGADIFNLNTVGNLNENSLKNIWEGEALFQLRKQHLQGKTREICSYCGCFLNQVDNIDDVADELLVRLENRRSQNY